MKKNLWTKALSMLLALIMVVGMIPATTIAAFADGVPETLVTSLTELYSGDETHARENLEALSAAGILDGDGKLVDLNIVEDGVYSVELDALAERIANGETVGEITVNGNAATSEQIVQISQVKAAIEIAELLDEEIDVTDEHVENLESLLTGIQNGNVDLENALKTGALSLKSTAKAPLLGAENDDDENKLTVSEDGNGYIGHYLSEDVYEENHVFPFLDTEDENKDTYYTNDLNARVCKISLNVKLRKDAEFVGEYRAHIDAYLSNDDGSYAEKLEEGKKIDYTLKLFGSNFKIKNENSERTYTTGYKDYAYRIRGKWDSDYNAFNVKHGISYSLNDMWCGSRALIVSVTNPTDALFHNDADAIYDKQMVSYSKWTEQQVKGNSDTENIQIKSISVPAATYTSGELVPIFVEFSAPVKAWEGAALTVNGKEAPLLDGDDLYSRHLMFGYTVKEEDSGSINVTGLNLESLKNNVTDVKHTFDSDDGVNIVSLVKKYSIDRDAVKWGIDQSAGIQTVTFLLPLKSGANTDWIASESVECTENGNGFKMKLPGYGESTIKYYLSGMYVSLDSGSTRYPLYVVTDAEEKPVALAARYAAAPNTSNRVRMDSAQIFMDPYVVTESDKYLAGWSDSKTDALGYHYFTGETSARLFNDEHYTYYVNLPVFFDSTQYIPREAEYETAKNGFIKLKGDDLEFPYVLVGDPDHPENQYDVEILVTKDFYDAIDTGVLYLAEGLEEKDLRVSYQISNRKTFSFVGNDQFKWSATADALTFVPVDGKPNVSELQFNKAGENTELRLMALNGDNAHSYQAGTMKINIRNGMKPFLMIPSTSKVRETLTGLDTDIFFSSNVTESNSNPTTTFKSRLYKIQEEDIGKQVSDQAQEITIEGWGSFDSTNDAVLTRIRVPGFSEPGIYAVVISADYQDVNGPDTLTTTAYLKVKQGPAKVSLKPLERYSWASDEIPTIGYKLTSANNATVEYTIQKSGEDVGERSRAEDGVIPFNPEAPSGLKEAYTITVYARNNENDAWSMDSMLLTVYNANALKLIVKDVAFGDVGGTTGGKAGVDGSTEAGESISIDNKAVIEEMLFGSGDGAGYKVDYRSKNFAGIDEFRTVVGLQKVISANYGEGTWGMLSDKMQWSATEADGETPSTSATLNYEQGGLYSNIRNFNYTSYVPTTDFLIVGKGETENNAEVTITAKHAATGKDVQVKVDVHTLRDKLYLFRFNPKTTTQVAYTNGDGVKRYLSSDEKGELAVYEPSGIQGNVMAMSEPAEGEIYVGTIYQYELSSGERDVTILDYYPCNHKTLKSISSVTLTFITPDGKPYDGEVILRGGVYKNGTYCPTALIKTSVAPDSGKNGREDVSVTAKAGKVKLWFDPTQFKRTNEDDILGADDTVSYAFEYRFAEEQNYQPGYVIINPASNDPTDSIVNLHTVSGSRTSPQIVRQDYQQYLNGTRATDYKRNVIDSTENIGISTNFPKAVLYTVIALPGESVTVGEQVGDSRGYSIYENADAIKFAFYPTGNETKLTGQTDISSDSVKAAQIINLSQINDETTYFVFPFSSMPMVRSTYVMTNDNLTYDGISDVPIEGKATAPTARIKAVFTRGNMTIASMNMPFGVSNLSHQPDLNSNKGATTVGKEVRSNLKESTDIGAIFRSINVNDMIRKGFVFLGNLAGAGGDNPINLMILPTQDPATFRIIAFVGANQRSSGEDEGLSVNFNSQDLAEDMSKFKKEMEELNKKKDDDNDSGGEGSMEFNFYGTIILEARVGLPDGGWNIAFRGGNVGTNVKGKYEWGQTFFCGPYPAFVSFEVGFHADLEVAFGNKNAVRAMLLDAALGVSVEAFAGLGFDLSIVAIQLGIYGAIGADVNFLLLTSNDVGVKNGTKLTISGEIGLKLKVKLLFISYTSKFASTGFNWTKYWGDYKNIDKNVDGFWKGTRTLKGLTKSGRAYTMYLFDDGSTIVEIDSGAELENRDYLELAERSWTGGVNRTRRAVSITDIQTNSYPYSHPAFTDDGEMFLYVSDNGNTKKVESVVNYSVKSSNGYTEGVLVDTTTEQKDILADLDVVASGTKDNAFAAWVKQVETPKRANKNAEITNDELSMMFNATEIYSGAYNGASWTTTRLTDNYVADMSPTVASYGSNAIVAWRSMNASSMTANGTAVQDITAMFDIENNINYSIYNGKTWTAAQVAYNGTAGTVNAIDSAMLSDGTAILVYTVRTGEDVTTTETFYTVIDKNGAIVTTGRLTKDSYTDTNAQVTAVNDAKNPENGYFVLGWYSEHDASEGKNADGEVVVAHDIRLARINANGSYDIDFPESIGGTGETGISSDFHFSAPANNTDLTNVSIVWSQKNDSDKAEDAGKYELNAVRFFKTDGVIGTTAPTDIAKTSKNYTIDHFDTYTDANGVVHAIILGTDYNDIEGIDKYDSIDLDKVTKELGENESNSDSPNNLDILDGEAISSLKLATGTFPATAADVTADINISEVIPGFTTPVQFTVTNTGTGKLTSVTATVGGQNKEFTELNLLPNQSATLLMSYSVPEDAVSDAEYSVTSGGVTLGSGTLALNRPDVGISGIKLLQEHDGVRDIQVMLGNSSEIPLAGSGKTVKLAFYKDPFHESMIGEAVSITGDALAEIDAGTYTTVRTLNVTDIAALVNGEIPEDGVTVYARAWVADTEEPNTYNNDNYISFTGLLARNNGEKLTADTTLEVNTNEQSEVTGYTVYADIRNNSMQDNNIGTPVAVLLDSEGKVIAQKNMAESLTLKAEEQKSLSVTFAATDIKDGAVPASSGVHFVYTIKFDVNGGTGEFVDATTDFDGHITLPTTTPTKTVEAGQDPLFFAGWYTDETNGVQITENYTFTSDTTVYAHYVNHQHDFTYSADGTTITATCKNEDEFCYLPEADGVHKATLTIAAPDSNTYTGSEIAAKITDENSIKGDVKVLYATKENDTYSTAVDTVPVNVGTYRASITLGTGEDAKTVSVDYNIENATLTGVSVTQNGKLTYTGEAQTPQVTTAFTAVNGQDVTFTYSLTQNGEYGDMPTFTNVADGGTVFYKASAPNHNDATGSFTVTVNKATPAAPAAPTMKNASASTITLNQVAGCEYSKDGTTWQESATFTGLIRLTSYTFYQRIAADDNHNESHASAAAQISTTNHDHDWVYFTANDATITATCANTDTFHPTEDKTATMTIAKPTLDTYGKTGDNISAEATVTNNIAGVNTPTIVYKQGETELDGAPTDAGTYTASITLNAADIGQENNVTASVTYTISKAPITVTAKAKTITYGDAPANDGVTYAGFVNNETASVLDGELEYTYSYTQFGDVGNTYTITPSGLTSDNYNITFNNGTLTVVQKEVGLDWTNTSFTYNGQPQKPTAAATGLVNNDAIGVTITGEQTNAGTNYIATASELTGDKAGNYKLPTATTQTFAIGKAPLTVTANDKTITYGDAPANDGVTYDGFVNGETESVLGGTLTYSYSYAQYGDVGNTYTITPSGLTGGNYDISFNNGTLTVVQKEVGLDWSNLSFTYDGKSHKPTAAATQLVYNDPVTVEVSGEQTNAGTHTATAALTGTKAGNYKLPEVYTQSFTIDKLEIKGAIVELGTFAYDTTVPTAKIVNDSNVDVANGTIVQGDDTKTVTYYYQATALLKSQTDAILAYHKGEKEKLELDESVFTELTATTFEPGKHYVLAVISGDNYTDTYITQSVFEVKQNTEKVRNVDLVAPEVDGTKVTVDEADKDKSLEYSLDGKTWKPVTLDENNEFTAEWETPVTNADLMLRETSDESYAKPSGSVVGTEKITTKTYTVTYDANGGVNAPDPVKFEDGKTLTISGKASMTRKGYTFTDWNTKADGTGIAYKQGDKLSVNATLYAQWEANTYKVSFNANGGKGTMEDKEFTYDVAQNLTQNAFDRAEYTFLGWSLTANGGVQYQDKQEVKNLTETGTVTLYAVWAKELYNINGTIKSAQTGNITLQLVQGNIAFGKSKTVEYTTADKVENFTLNGVPAGTYNLIATQGDITMTSAVIITDDHVALELITMPSGNASSVINVKSIETPAIVVGGLDKLAEDEIVEGRKVKVAIAIEAQNETQAGEAGKAIVKESRAQNAEFIDFIITKTITNKGVKESDETITETSSVIELVIPFDFSGKSTVKLYRYHDDKAEALTESDSKLDGTFRLDRTAGLIYVYTSRFSTYAITYSNYSASFASNFEPVIAETEHGTITVEPQKAQAGKEVVITATPDAGYKLAELTVKDAGGKEVTLTKNTDGTYTFTQPNGKVTVEAKFEKVKFVDVPENSFYADAVDWAVEKGITNGVDENHFAPDATCTRAQAVTFLWRALGCPEPKAAKSEFTDVTDANAFYYKAVLWAAENGVTLGYDDGRFGVNDTVNRAQMVTFMARALNGKATTAESFADVPEGAYFADAAAWAKENGISNGVGGNKFGSNENCARAQIVTMLYRYFVK